jgi:ABC-2 type transport system permease protein
MRKFWAVVRREYKKVVFTWTFLVGTLLAPFLASMFVIVPAILFTIKGESQKIVLVDQSGGQVAARLKENLSPERVSKKARAAAQESLRDLNQSQEEQMKRSAEQLGENFTFVDYDAEEKSLDQIRRELNALIQDKKIDAYLIIPQNFDAAGAKFEYYSRNPGDFILNTNLEDALNEAIRSERLARANISETQLYELSKKVNLDRTKVSDRGEEKDDGGAFGAAFIMGLLIYITLTLYGTTIMGAVVEEKETRIAEILFSSAKPFELMMGKLVGVGLAGLTQLSIWLFSGIVLLSFGLASARAAGFPISMPNITAMMVVYFLIFFLLGFFTFATIYALIGSIVPTLQEGGNFSLFPVLLMLFSFYSIFPVIRDPNSTFAFWASVAPFSAPLVMPVRILTETPPFWQIGLAILFNLLAIVLLVWIVSRVYRVGMLMYGKRATLPEIWKWIRQS